MNPYDPHSPCPKCGYSDHFLPADTEYEGPVEHLHALTSGQITTVEDHPEYLRRTCRRCRFTWKEAVLDNPE